MAAKKQEMEERAGLLDKPRVLFAEPGRASQFLFYGLLLLLGSVGALGSFFGAFQVPVAPLPALAVGCACLAFSLCLFLLKRPSWAISLAGMALWLGAVWLFFGDLVQGCAHTVNLVLDAYGDRLGMALPRIVTDPLLTPGDIQRQCTVFCCLFTFPYLFFLGWALVGRKSALAAFCLSGLMVCFPMVISLVPPAPYVVVLLLFWAALLLFSPTYGKRHRLLEDRSQYHAAGNSLARPAMLGLFLCGAALCMAVTYWVFPYSTYQRPQLANDLWEGLSESFSGDLGIQAQARGGVGSGNSRVDLKALNPRVYTGETVLRVRYDWDGPSQRKDFLKSFSGSVYTGSSWERLSGGDERELSALLDGLQPQTLPDALSREFQPLGGARCRLSVENVGANPRCVYAPYGMTAASAQSAPLEFVSDGFVKSSRFFGGSPSYELEAWALPQEFSTGVSLQGQEAPAAYPSLVFPAVWEGFLESQGTSPGSADAWQADGSQEISGRLTESLYTEAGEPLPNLDLWQLPEGMGQYLTQGQQALVSQLEPYNQFVYQHYTQLPEGLRDTLLDFLAESGLQYAGYGGSAVELARQVAGLLAERCSYTLAPPLLPEGEDFAEFFLFESREGYCVHFATAATALLRAMGVPARYAEGYAVPASEEGWVDVPDYNAHAWVEVYLGGAGWVPVEVTPAGPDAPAATEDARPLGSLTATPSPAPTSAPEATPAPQPSREPRPTASPSRTPGALATPNPQGPREEPAQSLPWGWAAAGGVLGGIALLAGAVLLRRKVLLALRERRFTQADRNRAALELYAAILRLRRAAARLPGWTDDAPPQLEQLALKARFSQHALTPQELEPFREELERLTRQLRQGLPTGRRLWCQYGLGLF